MDLSTLDTADVANQGAQLELRGPDGAPLLQDGGKPITITLLGADSDALTLISTRQTNRYLKNHGQMRVTAELARANELEYLARATVAWDGIKIDGKTPDCTEAEARALYARFPWITAQARAFIEDRANFMKASPSA
jgi:hypothetical protein